MIRKLRDPRFCRVLGRVALRIIEVRGTVTTRLRDFLAELASARLYSTKSSPKFPAAKSLALSRLPPELRVHSLLHDFVRNAMLFFVHFIKLAAHETFD